ncbi:hypothetical protein [Dyadobacter sp. CY351]|uniref:hypothetical protein n=1 Tax=Dyadobacter sp. CY351 TaxID=2909337 RepID=UPI001F29F7DD|nr:hypothetical protein [Dyadobacter sp. CY351]MCF2517414.1 hypothetical protein [Dyadobacter sp. CY351]
MVEPDGSFLPKAGFSSKEPSGSKDTLTLDFNPGFKKSQADGLKSIASKWSSLTALFYPKQVSSQKSRQARKIPNPGF